MVSISIQDVIKTVPVVCLLIGIIGLTITLKGKLKGWGFAIGIIISSAAFACVVLAYYWGQANIDRKRFYSYACDYYGVARDNWFRSVIIDENGGADVSLCMRIRAIKQDVHYLEQQYAVPGGQLDAVFTDTVAQCDNGSRIVLTTESMTKTTMYQKVCIVPPVRKSTSTRLSQCFHWTNKNAFAMTQEAMIVAGLPYEYCGMKTTYPCDTLSLVVTFPRYFDPLEVNVDVWYDQGRVRCESEHMKLNEGPSCIIINNSPDHRKIVTLSIPYPIVGLLYAITWKPPKNGDPGSIGSLPAPPSSQ